MPDIGEAMTSMISEDDVEEVGRVTFLAFSRVGVPLNERLSGEIIRGFVDFLERREVQRHMPPIPGGHR